MININPQEQHEILEKCKVLKEYGEFNDTVRKYQALNMQEPYKYAIEECIRQGILADYLSKKGSEVVNMLTAEYDYDLDIRVQREETKEEGKIEEKKEDILEVLRNMGEISTDLEQYVRKQTDIHILKRMFQEAIHAQTVDIFMERCLKQNS